MIEMIEATKQSNELNDKKSHTPPMFDNQKMCMHRHVNMLI